MKMHAANFKFFLGPKLPFTIGGGSTMVSSPIGKGVVIIGGYTAYGLEKSVHLIELSGDSIKSLKWTQLQQSLLTPKACHVSFIIPTQVANELVKIQTCTI